MMRRLHVLLCAVVLLAVVSSGCVVGPGGSEGSAEPNAVGSPVAASLGATEVREYQGEPLSSWTGFRENSIKGPQHIDVDAVGAGGYALRVDGLVGRPMSYSYPDVLSGFDAYEKAVTLNCVEGWSVRILWKGVLVRDIIEASAPTPAANTVIFHAYDGYTTSFPLDYLLDNDILMAYGMNNVTLPDDRGFPFQLVAESKWGYKWIKWVTEIELSDDPDYKGYWESRGYSNSGNLNSSFFG
jgi:DMSO/TMAO reductase YedYZ molybdopterin-dependent catalytic subunit